MVGAHGLEPWGPVIVNYLHDTRVAQGVPRDHVYDLIFYVLACLLVAGFICNALIRPVRTKWHIEEEVGINTRTLVGIPLAWGVWQTLENAAKIFQ
jgi:cytochrome b